MNDILKAIKDWCLGKFQKKGDYVTTDQLENFSQGSGTSGISSEDVQAIVSESIFETTSGVRIVQNEEGKWGYIPLGADAVIPFSDGNPTTINPSATELFGAIPIFESHAIIITEGD